MDSPLHSLDWSLVQAFLAVADSGSLSAAARDLGLSQPTLGRHVRRMEEETGLTLFSRQPRGLALTAEGQALIPAARRMAEAMADMALAVAGHDAESGGSVRITASEVVAHHILPVIAARIRRDAPQIELEIDASDASGNLLYREADIALRMYRPEQLDVVTRKLGEIEIGCFAATGYLDRRGRPETVSDLAGHDLVGFDRSELMIRTMREMGWMARREDFAIRCDNQVSYWEYVRAGCGIGFYQAHVGRSAPGVEEIPFGLGIPGLPVWIAAHDTIRRIPRVDHVWRQLEAGIAPYLRRA
ncbi:MAG: LysR family transcriptional regulator [Pseudooceanicola sp.]